MEYVVRALRAWAVPLVVPLSGASRPFESEGVLFDEATDKQLLMLGAEVMRVGRLFLAGTVENAVEHCAEAAARVACTGAGAHESPARAIRFTRGDAAGR